MGLDMYLTKKTYVRNWDHQTPDEKHEIIVELGGKVHPHIKPERISNITEMVGQWRKFNALHSWFVQNVQDGEDNCQESYVSTEKLEELLVDLKKIKEQPEVAEDVLPTAGGFFFGGEEYDEYYHKNVSDTIDLIEGLVKEEEGGNYYYQASW